MPPTISNDNANLDLLGAGAYDGRLHYVSVVGTSQEVRSLKATIVSGKSLHSLVGRVKHEKGAPWSAFSSSVPNSFFHHWIWISLDPDTITLIEPKAILSALKAQECENQEQYNEYQKQRADYIKELRTTDLPKRLVRNVNKGLPIPLDEAWSEQIASKALLHRLIRAGSSHGDCIGIYHRETDPAQWKALTIELLADKLIS
jgi:hypothetical protein